MQRLVAFDSSAAADYGGGPLHRTQGKQGQSRGFGTGRMSSAEMGWASQNETG